MPVEVSQEFTRVDKQSAAKHSGTKILSDPVDIDLDVLSE